MVAISPHPFRTDPFVREKIWGGRKLPDVFGKRAPAEARVGETWEVADLEEGQSRSDTDPTRGTTLGRLVDDWGGDLVGTDTRTEAFPLLVKLIDASRDLSVQVHPSEADVRDQFPEANSKDECWVIVDAEPDGAILHGVRAGVDAKSFRRAVRNERATELLRRVDVEAGDVVRVPPGTIHAICSGVTLLEIQEPSDTTYRVYDYGREGLDGEPRELHLDAAMEVANFGQQPPTSVTGSPIDFGEAAVEHLVDVGTYRIERARLRSPTEWRISPDSPQVLHLLSGSAELQSEGTTAFELGCYQTAVVPAACEGIGLRPDDEVLAVVAGLGGAPLLA